MNKKRKITLYLTVIIIGLLIVFGVCSSKDFFNEPIFSEKIRILSDACLLPAVIYCGIGGLVYVSNNGFFRIFSFGTRRILSHFSKTSDFRERYKDYYEYYIEKDADKASFGFILYPGLGFLLLSIVFMLWFNYIS